MEKKPLTREDVMRLLQEAGSPDKLDLSGRDLEGIDLSGLDLHGANLSKAKMLEANLGEANLSKANLREADLWNANIWSANLTESNLRDANLCDANLFDANLSSANLFRANLLRVDMRLANLNEADLREAQVSREQLLSVKSLKNTTLPDGTKHAETFTWDDIAFLFQQAGSSDKLNLRGRNLEGIDLSHFNLHGADIGHAYLARANLNGTNLFKANLGITDLSSANLQEANLGHALLLNANLSNANLREADLRGANLGKADLSGANLEGANLEGANLGGATVTDEQLAQTKSLKDATMPDEKVDLETDEMRDTLPDGLKLLWHAGHESLRLRNAFTNSEGEVIAVAFRGSPSQVFSGSNDGTLTVWDEYSGQVIATLQPETRDRTTAMVIVPDSGYAFAGSNGGILTSWDLQEGQIIEREEMFGNDQITAIVVTPDDHYAVFASKGGLIVVVDMQTKEAQLLSDKEERGGGSLGGGELPGASALAITPDGRYVIAGFGDNPGGSSLRVWDLQTRQIVWRLADYRDDGSAIAVTSDSRCAIIGSTSGVLKVLDLQTGQTVNTFGEFSGYENWVTAIAVIPFPPDRYVIAGSINGALRIWDLQTGQIRKAVAGHDDRVNAIATDAAGTGFISGSSDGTLKVWDLWTDLLEKQDEDAPVCHQDQVSAIAVTSDCRSVISGSYDRTVRVWSMQSGQLLQTFDTKGRVTAVAITPDAHYTISGSQDGSLRAWDLQKGQMVRKMEEEEHEPAGARGLLVRSSRTHTDEVWVIAITPDSRYAISGSHFLRIWDLQTGQIVRKLYDIQHPEMAGRAWNAITALAVTPDGLCIVAGSYEGTLMTVQGQDLQTVRPSVLLIHEAPVTAIAVAPDSRHVVFGSANGALKVCDLQTRQIVKELQAGLHIEEEEREQVVGLPTETVRIVSTKRNLQPLQGYKEWVTSVAITPEGRYAISSSRSHFLKFWDLQTGENIVTIRLEAALKGVSFTQEATLLLTGDNVGNVDCLRYVNVR